MTQRRRRNLPEWSAECSPVFFREHVRIQIGDPLLAFLGHLQIAERIADIGPDHLPEEAGVRCPQIVRGRVSALLGLAGFPEFGKQRRRLAQVADVGQLADQVGGAKQAWIIRRAGMLLVLRYRYRKTRVLDVGLDLFRIDVGQALFPEALADEQLRSRGDSMP